MDWLSFAKEFQTAIVGVIGFGGVILTQVLNARYARQREDAARLAKQTSILRGALAELKLHRESFAITADEVSESDSPFVQFPIPKRAITSGLMTELGWLPKHVLDDTLYALMTIDEIGRRFSVLAHSTDGEYVAFNRENWPSVQKGLKNTLPKLDKAIAALEDVK